MVEGGIGAPHLRPGESVKFNGGLEGYLNDNKKGPPRRYEDYTSEELANLPADEVVALMEQEDMLKAKTTDEGDPDATKIINLSSVPTRISGGPEQHIGTAIVPRNRNKKN
jgi:hypothetical protein